MKIEKTTSRRCRKIGNMMVDRGRGSSHKGRGSGRVVLWFGPVLFGAPSPLCTCVYTDMAAAAQDVPVSYDIEA